MPTNPAEQEAQQPSAYLVTGVRRDTESAWSIVTLHRAEANNWLLENERFGDYRDIVVTPLFAIDIAHVRATEREKTLEAAAAVCTAWYADDTGAERIRALNTTNGGDHGN